MTGRPEPAGVTASGRPEPDGAAAVTPVTPVRTAVRARDPISQAGVVAQLGIGDGDVPGVRPVVVTGDDDTADVLVVVGDTVDDWLLAQLDALAATAGPKPRPVLVVGQLDDTAGLQAIEAGGLSMVRRAESTAGLLREVVRAAARGEARLPTDLLSSLLTRVGRAQRQVLAPGA
ncbi:hypothetical protein GA0074692_4013 [Micromonospora pallida]|uniref:Response regulatory domain-containing protein n=1 Tax=Micromonospora pallida TaxID=145854 RepID=A0A1C6T0H4_9ACTN|nr:hypothetical protein [Micromonospora pallida]SCL35132.1 hypothetical protein GA0074692_4013 [Micromonospora pallida]